MKDCNPRNTPFLCRVKIEEESLNPLVNSKLYKHLIGCLIYLNQTQPYIFYAVSVASRHMDQLHDIHWGVAKRILSFVQGTKTHGIDYVAQSSLELVGFTDSDWEGDNNDRK